MNVYTLGRVCYTFPCKCSFTQGENEKMFESEYIASIAGSAIAAAIIIVLVSLIREPHRQSLMAIVVALSGFMYWEGGFGWWEVPFGVVIALLAWKGLTWYPAIGLAWLVHAIADMLHHIAGYPMVPSQPLSSFGCLTFDTLIATWFLAGAPSAFRFLASRRRANPVEA